MNTLMEIGATFLVWTLAGIAALVLAGLGYAGAKLYRALNAVSMRHDRRAGK